LRAKINKSVTANQLHCARDFKLIFFRENTAVHNLSNIQEVKTHIFYFKSNSKRKMPKRETICPIEVYRNHRDTMIEYEERTERLRQVLESRRAQSAKNDQEKVQSTTPKGNINEISNDAKKAK
jgi:hypothetical protein